MRLYLKKFKYSCDNVCRTDFCTFFVTLQLSKLAETIMLRTCIKEMSRSNLGRNTNCPEVFMIIPESLQVNSDIEGKVKLSL
jgi:hypothetical protein